MDFLPSSVVTAQMARFWTGRKTRGDGPEDDQSERAQVSDAARSRFLETPVVDSV
jgi:hypothetical protein